jgi:hypothetical protein
MAQQQEEPIGDKGCLYHLNSLMELYINLHKLFKTDPYINSFIHSLMALQPFVGPWPLLQFHNLFYTGGRTPWTGDQPVARPLPTHRTTQTQNKRRHTDIHALSGIRTHDPSVRASEDSSCLRAHGPCDRHIKYL